jgi:hypothetical protein
MLTKEGFRIYLGGGLLLLLWLEIQTKLSKNRKIKSDNTIKNLAKIIWVVAKNQIFGA